MDELTKNDIIDIIEITKQFKQNPCSQLLKGSILASCFLSPQHAHAYLLNLPHTASVLASLVFPMVSILPR